MVEKDYQYFERDFPEEITLFHKERREVLGRIQLRAEAGQPIERRVEVAALPLRISQILQTAGAHLLPQQEVALKFDSDFMLSWQTEDPEEIRAILITPNLRGFGLDVIEEAATFDSARRHTDEMLRGSLDRETSIGWESLVRADFLRNILVSPEYTFFQVKLLSDLASLIQA